METRSKRKQEQETPDSSSKRARGTASDEAKPKTRARASREPAQPSQAASKPRSNRGARAPAPEQQIEEPPPAAAPPPPPAADKSMDRSGRRSSRGDPAEAGPSGGEEDHGDVFGRNFAGASSALQGLLRKLGAGFEDIMSGGHTGSRIKGIISGLRQFEDEGAQLSALTELSELLSISQEESLAATLPVEQVVPLLVQLLNMEHNPDVMLLAARCLTFMADVLPTSCGAIVRHGAVQAFCARLLAIEYIDLAEQSLQALDKLSNEHPAALLQQGGLAAVLSYLDFFPTGVQRVAVATAAKMCAALAPQHASAARDAVPLLTNLLQYQDGKMVDSACAALCCTAEAFAGDAGLLELLLSSGAAGQAAQLIALSGATGGMASQLSLGTYYGLIRLLATCAAGSAAVSESLLQGPLVDTLRQLLASSAMLSAAPGGACVLRTADQLSEVVGLAAALLPPVPDAAALVLQGLPARPPGGG
ncbi:MAG: armadillo-type protein, partial [Monoraphidium minutum]